MENGGDDNKVMRGDALFAEADMIAQSQLSKLRTFVAAKQANDTATPNDIAGQPVADATANEDPDPCFVAYAM